MYNRIMSLDNEELLMPKKVGYLHDCNFTYFNQGYLANPNPKTDVFETGPMLYFGKNSVVPLFRLRKISSLRWTRVDDNCEARKTITGGLKINKWGDYDKAEFSRREYLTLKEFM